MGKGKKKLDGKCEMKTYERWGGWVGRIRAIQEGDILYTYSGKGEEEEME